jgi:hypothetical protein
MITLDEGHQLPEVFENLAGFASEVFLVDSFSSDATVDLALAAGAHVVQRRFRGFGDQWDYAATQLPITQPWTMKLDPDERLSDELKASIREIIGRPGASAFSVSRRLWFMGRALPIRQRILRGWLTGTARFEHVAVNEHPIVHSAVTPATGDLAHLDSPNLHHWFEKQNAYTTAEAITLFSHSLLAARPRIWGNALERRMWLKSFVLRTPFAGICFFIYYYIVCGAWLAGRVGFEWCRLRADVYRMISLKQFEQQLMGRAYVQERRRSGSPNTHARQADERD